MGLAIFIGYLALVVVLGLLASRGQRDSADFWVAGRRFGIPVLVLANVAAIMHGGSILSGVAAIGKFGGVAALPFLAFALGIAVLFFFFARKLRQSGGFTLPDYLGDRYDSRALRAWAAIVVAVSSVVYLVAQLRGMAFILESLLDIPFIWGLALGAIIFVGYVALGGLLAVVWTNIAQFFFMWVGLLLIAPVLVQEVGGWTAVMQQVEQAAPGWTSLRGVSWGWGYVLSWQIIWMLAYCTRLELITKMYAARDSRVARVSLPWTILIVLLFLLYGNLYLGAAARITVWDGLASPDQAYVALVSTYLAPALAAVALTGIAAAAMSTTDSLLLMAGSALAHDLVRRCVDEPRGVQRDERRYVWISRLSIVAVGALAFVLAIPDVALILRIVSFAVAIIGAAFFFPLIAGMTGTRVSAQAALASSVGGVLVTVAWIAGTLAGQGWAQSLHPGIPGLIVSGVLIGVVSRFTPPAVAVGGVARGELAASASSGGRKL
ncbi:sodium:solute symporter family protein [Candidatus Foliamicus sp.]